MSRLGNCLEQCYALSPFHHKHQRNEPVVGTWVEAAPSLVAALLEKLYSYQRNDCTGINCCCARLTTPGRVTV